MIFEVKDVNTEVILGNLNVLLSYANLSRYISTTTTQRVGGSDIKFSSKFRLYVQLAHDPHENEFRITIPHLLDYLGVHGSSEYAKTGQVAQTALIKSALVATNADKCFNKGTL